MKILCFLLFSLSILFGCAGTPSPYRFETPTISNIKIHFVTTKVSAGKILLNGQLFCSEKLGPQRQGHLVVKIYSPAGELLQTQNANYKTPISHHEWQSGVAFAVTLAINPPDNSLIQVAFSE